MNSYLRNSSILRVMDSMNAAAPRFEEFGARLLNYMLSVAMNHRGLNVLGHSVGYTVDSYDDTGEIAAQYSAQKKYFDDMAEKPVDDVLHVMKLKPETAHIFLISSDECSPADEERLRARFAAAPGFGHRRLHIYNRRRIAEYIVEHLLLVDSAVDDLSQYLPVLHQIASEHSETLVAPKPALSYRERAEVDQALVTALEKEKCIVLAGIGGLGKSQAAAVYAESARDRFELVIWADGLKLKGVEDLQALEMGRAGLRRNVVGMLKNRRCLLVIDDLATKIEPTAFAALCGPDSRVLVTQREATVGSFELPLMTEELAKSVLTEGVDAKIEKEQWQRIWETVNGHPLSLSLMNAAARDGASWTELADDCKFVGEMLDDGYRRLTDRLLLRFEKSLGRELGLFRWLNARDAYKPLLKAIVGSVGLRKLRLHSLEGPSTQAVLRLHDVIYAALKAATWVDEGCAKEFTDRLDAFLLEAATSPSVDLRATAAVMQEKLVALVKSGEARPSFIYALLQGWEPGGLDRDMVADPAAQLESIDRLGRPALAIESAVLLETIESLYRADKQAFGPDVAKQALKERIGLYDKLASKMGLTPLQQAEILHHKGKTLALLGDSEAAKACFETVVDGATPLYESRLQLVKVYSRLKRRSDAIAQAEVVLSAARQPNTVSNSVVLATICAVPSGPERDEFMANYADVAAREIVVAAEAGLDQAFEALVAVSRSWRYRDPERLRAVWQSVDVPTPSNDSQRFIQAELYQNVSHIQPDMVHELRAKSLALYGEMAKLDDFQRQQFADALLNAGRADDALSVIAGMKHQSAWSHYLSSKALMKVERPEESLGSINLAIEMLPEANSNFRSSFLAQRFDVRASMGDPDASIDLLDAINECREERYLIELQHRLSRHLNDDSGRA